jgi:Ca2+-binding EF-hand superfamily protein
MTPARLRSGGSSMSSASRRCRAVPILVGLAALAAWAPPAPGRAQAPAGQDLRERFRSTDKNGDAKVDREEFHQRTVEVFYFLDKQRKGYLLIAEIDNVTPERFRGADANGDGRLSLEEFLNARFRDFEAADRNKDGVLTLEEVEIYVRQR